MFHADEDGAGDHGKSDGDFLDVVDGFLENLIVLVIQSVSGVDTQSEVAGAFGGKGEEVGLTPAFGIGTRVGEIPRMEFDAVRAHLGCSLDLFEIRIDKERNLLDAGLEELFCDGAEPIGMAYDIQAAFRGNLFPAFRHERRKLGLDLAADVHDLVCRREFEIELGLDNLFEEPDIVVGYVAPVLAEVEDDPVCACHLADDGGVDRIGERLTACITERCDVIDINEKVRHVK